MGWTTTATGCRTTAAEVRGRAGPGWSIPGVAALLLLSGCRISVAIGEGADDGASVCALRSMCVEATDDLAITVAAAGTDLGATLRSDEVRLRLETVEVRAESGEADLLLSATGCVDVEWDEGGTAGPYDVRWALTCLLQLRSADLPPGTSAADACAAEASGAETCDSPRPFYLAMTVSLDEQGWIDDSSCWWDPYSPWGGCAPGAAHVEGAIDVGEVGFGATLRFGDGCFPEIDFTDDRWQVLSPVADPAACDWPDPTPEESGCG